MLLAWHKKNCTSRVECIGFFRILYLMPKSDADHWFKIKRILFSDGANGIKYNLTADIIESIFKTYPAVKRKHLENVPSKMKEQEFW